mmetsp:Transcript_3474/g.4865  ORF Transcript_3474/g.4865 Transcript_3474/m.4865 type:complete len:359 (-) Transcript_3474:665-1741(-)|eukprot:CAMPEP_0197301762 /NCGR_PEP_ID=MMETSP0890-20130614/50604_1 /TAXON_ID=44058 ORGANISM="Aureoumbra lagunensis, Strain CCMP1510" /NCGR_SAMPLE_ID=MMETSP0890 /ASSEMBLY_ACC=CAM_ASM_000533 /LENGTH=358 /DNA_ID=CAMNT_0042781143 /DNA_START=961 /DNA_END=2037 /DNA_ORIENTATION=-
MSEEERDDEVVVDDVSSPTVRKTSRLWVVLLIIVLVIRMYGKLKETAQSTLAQGEWPREDDVVIVGLPSVNDALVAGLEASGMVSVPNLERGSTRAALATSKFPSWPNGFWLDPKTASRLNAASSLEPDTANSLTLRIFSSCQKLDPTAVGASELSSDDDNRGDCAKDMYPYTCLCPNCPVRWTTIVYVVDAEPCRVYGASWVEHVTSYTNATNASVSLLIHPGDHAKESFHTIRTPVDDKYHLDQHILIVRDEDIRKKTGRATAAILAWLLDVKRKIHDLGQSHLQVDHDHIASRVESLARMPPKLTPKACSRPIEKFIDSIDSLRGLLGYDALNNRSVTASPTASPSSSDFPKIEL